MAKVELTGQFSHKDTSVSVRLNMYIFKEDDAYIVYCPALDLSAYGNSEEEAKHAFEKTLDMHIAYCLNKKTLHEDLKSHGWDIRGKKQRKIKAPSFDKLLKNNEALKDIARNKEYSKYNQDVSIPAC